jgi:hypothetical protein
MQLTVTVTVTVNVRLHVLACMLHLALLSSMVLYNYNVHDVFEHE